MKRIKINGDYHYETRHLWWAFIAPGFDIHWMGKNGYGNDIGFWVYTDWHKKKTERECWSFRFTPELNRGYIRFFLYIAFFQFRFRALSLFSLSLSLSLTLGHRVSWSTLALEK